MDSSMQWGFTVIRAQGLRLMRPEKSWRPIITVEIDEHHKLETLLGSDGQNVNLKEVFFFDEISLSSQVDVKVFHRAQSKKKGKKRNLVGTARCSVGEMLNRHGMEPKLELSLQCQSARKHSTSSRGRPQNGAHVHLKLRPPSGLSVPPIQSSEGGTSGLSDGYSSSDSEVHAPPTPPQTPEVHQSLRKRKPRVRGYCLDSEDEAQSYSHSEYEDEDEKKPLLDFSTDGFDEDEDLPQAPVHNIRSSPLDWIAASLDVLPRYQTNPNVTADPKLTSFERALASFTKYRLLQRAQDGDMGHCESVFMSYQKEWTVVGGLLIGASAFNTAVFSIPPDSIFFVNPYARTAVAGSSIASGLGIACDAWFLFRYGWSDAATFMARAEDVTSTPENKSYVFFCLSSHLPSFLFALSALGLALFLVIVAFNAWPSGVLAGCFIVGLLLGLQFLVYAVRWVVRLFRAAGKKVVRLFSKKPENQEKV